MLINIVTACLLSLAGGTLQVHLAFTGDLTSMGVSWRTAQPLQSAQVQFQKQLENQQQPHPAASVSTGTTTNYTIYGSISGYYHFAELSNLTSNTRYSYKVSTSASGTSSWSDSYNFTSPRAETDEVVRTATIVRAARNIRCRVRGLLHGCC